MQKQYHDAGLFQLLCPKILHMAYASPSWEGKVGFVVGDMGHELGSISVVILRLLISVFTVEKTGRR